MAWAGAVVGGLIAKKGSDNAAKAQEAAAARDIEFQKETRDIALANSKPWLTSGTAAQNALAFENGIGERPEGYGGYTKTPGYDFRLQQGQDSIQSGAAARGGLYSGAAMKALQSYGQDYATADYGNHLARLTGMSNSGLNAATLSANIGQNAASGVSNALSNMGNAQAAGYIGGANALNQGFGNAVGLWNYQKQIGGGQPSNGLMLKGGLFGGNSWGV